MNQLEEKITKKITRNELTDNSTEKQAFKKAAVGKSAGKKKKSQNVIHLTSVQRLLEPTQVYVLARRRLEELKRTLKETENELNKCPRGKMHIVKTNNRVQYYLRTDAKDKSGTYLKKKDELKIRKYLQKSYDEKINKLLHAEVKSIETFLKHSDKINCKIRQIYSQNPTEVKKYIDPIDCSDDDYIDYWNSISYEKNPLPIQSAVYLTENGEYVRSKSELNIANLLLKAGIPYKYECPLKLQNGNLVYPDFTVLEVKSRRVLYWEHRGMMDDREYSKNAVKKMKIYMQNGIFVGKNLIITEETSNNPLGTDEISEMVQHIKEIF